MHFNIIEDFYKYWKLCKNQNLDISSGEMISKSEATTKIKHFNKIVIFFFFFINIESYVEIKI